MSEEIPELPKWINDLIESAKNDGYNQGYEDGLRYAWCNAKRAIEDAGRYYL